MLADGAHLSRLVRDEIPLTIASVCASWYGAYRILDDAHGYQITTLRGLYNSWPPVPTERPQIEKQIREAAVQVVGEHPDSLIARRVCNSASTYTSGSCTGALHEPIRCIR